MESNGSPILPGLELLELRVRTNLNEIWRAKRQEDGAPVAVKIAATAAGPDLLRQEAKIVHALQSAGLRGVVPSRFFEDPVPHLVLPWKGGRTLRDAIGEIRSPDDRSRAIAAFLTVVKTVADAHTEGFLHGDLKPENVLLDEEARPWLTDFGMARAIRNARLESHISLSMSGSADGWGGTIHYLPPEGIQGEAPTAQWDVYALGVILHEILLGRRPDRAATPEHLKSVLPEEVVQVLLDALAYLPKDRIKTVQLLRARLEAIRGELTAKGPVRWFHRSKRLGLAGLAAFFVALRYGTVVGLLALYGLGIVSCFVISPMMLFVFIPVVVLHGFIRWEGPETYAEAELRRRGAVLRRR